MLLTYEFPPKANVFLPLVNLSNLVLYNTLTLVPISKLQRVLSVVKTVPEVFAPGKFCSLITLIFARKHFIFRVGPRVHVHKTFFNVLIKKFLK